MHGKLARGRRNNLHKLPQIDLAILCKLAKNKGGGQSHMENKPIGFEREYFLIVSER